MRALVLGAAIALMVPAAAIGQNEGGDSLRAAAIRGGRELADGTVATTPDRGWRRVRDLRPGALIRVITIDTAHHDVYVLSADESVLTAVSVAPLSRRAGAALVEFVREYPGTLPVRGRQVHHGTLRLDPAGVSFDGVREADLHAVELAFARDEIAEVKTRASDPRAVAAAVAGGALGAAIGVRMLIGLAMKPCSGGCGGRKAAMVLSGVGLPLGGALGGGLAFSRGEWWRTLYAR